jgi:hypothetical protein
MQASFRLVLRDKQAADQRKASWGSLESLNVRPLGLRSYQRGSTVTPETQELG